MTSQQRGNSLHFLLPALAAAILLPSAGRAQNVLDMLEGVRVVRSTQSELVLEITPRTRIDRVAGGLLLPSVGSSVVINSDRAGEPMAMRLTVPVALPGPTGSSVEVLSASYDAPVVGRLAPVPEIVGDRMTISTPVYRIDDRAYAAWRESTPVAELRYNGIARDVYAGTVAVRPYEYDAARGELRMLSSMRVRLRYGGAGSQSASVTGGRGLSEMTRMAFVNATEAQAWTILPSNASRNVLGRRNVSATARAWMRVEVKEDGLYQLTSDDFKKGGIDLSTVDPSKIAIYGGDGGELSESDLMTDVAGMHQIPAVIEQSGGRATRVLFYGSGPYRWIYRGTDSTPTHRTNPYVKSISYIVAVDGDASRGFEQGGTGGTPGVTLTSGITRTFFEEDRLNAVDIRKGGGSGRDWFGTQFQVDDARASDPRVFSMGLPGLDHSQPVLYRVRTANAGRSTTGGGPGTFLVEQRDADLGSFTIDGIGGERIAWGQTRSFIGKGSDIGGDNNSLLKITYSNGAAATGYLDWYEIHYGRQLRADGDKITFDAPPGAGLAQFVVQDFSSGDFIGLDVTDPANPLMLQSSTSDGRFTFTDQLHSSRTSRRYFITTRSQAKRVASAAPASFGNLRERMLNVDVIVIAPAEFKSVAEKYVQHRSSTGLSAAYVTAEEIYNEFSSGKLDPTAIRNYLAWAFTKWDHKPSYVLLMGDGNYDYRNIANQQKQYIPPYESDDGDIYDHIESSSTDDFFVRVTSDAQHNVDNEIDMAIGRLPVESVEQAEAVLNKIKLYENSRNYGLWRGTIALAADDDYPLGDGGGFTRQSEGLWRILPNWLEPKKIYVAAYPTEQVAARRKPGAAEDLRQTINRGAVITNWVGHGNPNVWAHEYILEKDQFIPSLKNDSTLTYVPAVTCNFGYFDDPTIVSGGELFMLHPNGGAVAVMTATRAVYIGPNEELMRQHFRSLFVRDNITRRFPTIGQALVITKYGRSGYTDNDQKFLLFGDPAMRLNLPHDSVVVTGVNSVKVDSSVATVGALSQVTITGKVLDHFGTLRGDFNGTAVVSLYDADRTVSTESGEETTNVIYYGGRLFRGPANVRNGEFSITFRVPKDIAYDTATGRIHVYAYNDHDDAAGMTPNIRIFGSDTARVTDTKGPDIRLFMDDRSFRSGDVVTPEPLLIVDLRDTSGVNSSGSSIGHRIEAWIDGSAKSVDLTETYQTLPTNYGEGTAERRLLSLEPGEHSVRVRAWDIYNNVSETVSYFRISEADEKELKVVDVVNYPNPMSRETDFLFRHNQSEPLDVEIGIYTLGGRKLRTLEADGVSERFVRVHWDGTDADGRQLANGVYLYRLRVRVAGDDSRQFETIEKVAIVR